MYLVAFSLLVKKEIITYLVQFSFLLPESLPGKINIEVKEKI